MTDASTTHLRACTGKRMMHSGWGSFSIAFLVAAGFFVVWSVLLAWSMQLWPAARLPNGVSSESLGFTLSGEPIISQYLEGNNWRYLDLNRQPLSLRAEETQRYLLSLPADASQATFLSRQRQVITLGMTKDPYIFWYLIQNYDRSGFCYFEAIHRGSRKTTGYLGRKGWQTNRPAAAEQFDISKGGIFGSRYGLWPTGSQPNANSSDDVPLFLILVENGRPLRVDLKEQTVELFSDVTGVISATRLDKTITKMLNGHSYASSEATDEVALRTAEKIVAVNITTGANRTWILADPQVQKASYFLFLDDGKLLASTIKTRIPDLSQRFQSYLSHDLYWLDPSGKIERTVQVEFPPSQSTELKQVSTFLIMSGTPVPSLLFALGFEPVNLSQIENLGYFTALKKLLPYIWPCFLVAAFHSIAAILLTRRHANVHRTTLHPAWYLFVAILGIPGYLGYRWHRAWPPQVTLTAPVLTGAEILVPA